MLKRARSLTSSASKRQKAAEAEYAAAVAAAAAEKEKQARHFRLIIVELCLKRQPGHGWMSLPEIRASVKLDPAEFLEQLENDPNVEKSDDGLRLRYVENPEYASHVDVEYRTAVAPPPPPGAEAAVTTASAAPSPPIEARLKGQLQRIFSLLHQNAVGALQSELKLNGAGARSIIKMTGELIQQLGRGHQALFTDHITAQAQAGGDMRMVQVVR